MLGVRSEQRGVLEADRLNLDHVGRHSLCGFLVSMRGQLFRDEAFAELYCPNSGRVSLEAGTCTCPAGRLAGRVRPVTTRSDCSGRAHRSQGRSDL